LLLLFRKMVATMAGDPAGMITAELQGFGCEKGLATME